jgi:hypothetical protein
MLCRRRGKEREKGKKKIKKIKQRDGGELSSGE